MTASAGGASLTAETAPGGLLFAILFYAKGGQLFASL
jgi:hypothetical protein